MAYLRSLLFNAFFIGWTAVLLLVMWTALPLPRRHMQRFVRLWGEVTRAGQRVLVGTRFEIRGREHLPAGAAVIASKHQSAWDTAIFHALAPDPAYVLKKELDRIPLWGVYARKCGAIIVDRTGGASTMKALIRGATAVLAENRPVVIFPEGTRTAPGERQPYHPGVAALYLQCKAPVVPVAVNSGIFWGRRAFLKRPGTIVLEILPPLPPGLDRKAFLKELEDRIETATARLEAEAGAAPLLPRR